MERLKVGARVLVCDPLLLTLRKQKQIKKQFEKTDSTKALKTDGAILDAAVEEFTTNPPTSKRLYEVFMELMPDPEADKKEDDEGAILELMCAVCCKWEGEEKNLTVDEFNDLPYEIAVHISEYLFTKNERDFLLVTPESTVA